jgi:hypothetical protein
MNLIIFLKSKENIIILSLFMVFALLICFTFFDIVHITKGDKTSTISYLSDVGVGALAGVLAIVISVTLVAVQFSSQYSPRVMDYFTKAFLFLIGVYIPTIVFNVLILNRIEEGAAISTKMIDISIVLTILCFILIAPYFLYIIHDLRPVPLIARILRKIDQKFVKINAGQKIPLPLNSDHVLPVAEIIEKAVKSNDRSTVGNGLDKMYECYDNVITKENNNFLSEYFLYHFSNIANTAILNSDNDTINKIGDIFVKMAEPHNSKEMTYATDNAIVALRQIAESATNQKLTDVTIKTVEKFVAVVNSTKSDKNMDMLFRLGQIVSEQKELEIATKEILIELGKFEYVEEIGIIGISAAQNNQKVATIEALATLVDLAEGSDSEKKAETIMDVAIEIIVEATNHELAVQLASEKIGRYMCKKISNAQNNEEKIYNIKKVEEKLNIYGNEACKFNIQECKPNEIILEVKNCFIKTIEKLDDEEIKSYCDKAKKCQTELPVCTITYSYLACAIKRVKQCKNVKLKKPLEWNENGLCKLTFVLE